MNTANFTAHAPMMLFELRVLSGLHQGAALPLLGEQWSIGADDEADLALYDPGIAPRHAQLQVAHGQWSVQAHEGLVQDETGAVLARITDLTLNCEFSVGGIRLCVCSADSAWPLEPARVSEAWPEKPVSPPNVSPRRCEKTRFVTLSVIGFVCLLVVMCVVLVTMPADNTQSREASLSGLHDKQALTTAHEVGLQLAGMLKEREMAEEVRLAVLARKVTLSGDV